MWAIQKCRILMMKIIDVDVATLIQNVGLMLKILDVDVEHDPLCRSWEWCDFNCWLIDAIHDCWEREWVNRELDVDVRWLQLMILILDVDVTPIDDVSDPWLILRCVDEMTRLRSWNEMTRLRPSKHETISSRAASRLLDKLLHCNDVQENWPGNLQSHVRWMNDGSSSVARI